MLVSVYEKQPQIRVEQLDAVLTRAAAEARSRGLLNLVFLEAENGDFLGLVVGGEETVLCFDFGHGDPPYYASRGASSNIEPLLTCYLSLEHHTEFPRKNVIPAAEGRLAAHEFLKAGALPQCIEWEEV
jgi:hypothetical protein